MPPTCRCGSGEPYESCCAPYHQGDKQAPTAEALMRSRFTAFALRDEAYLLATWHPTTRPRHLDFDPDQHWTHLQIHNRTEGTPFHTTGTVEFTAHYRYQGEPQELHENSRFTREATRWLYVEPI
ncbi:YchJ family metal-binding protein [Saccharothrix sp. NPDC042600]|uniref:YchJ family protein n=1 Tax=Saccharothrix sp. NPDC042600 TaxID=3154492 RepID=UPI0033D052DF